MAPHLTELSKVFQSGCFDFAQVTASVELYINKLSEGVLWEYGVDGCLLLAVK